jgi:hypothetical protein
MMNTNNPVVIRRYPASFLTDIVYSIQPMTTELAEVIRTLRRDHEIEYGRLGFYLCETDPRGLRSDWARRSLNLPRCICTTTIPLGFSHMSFEL